VLLQRFADLYRMAADVVARDAVRLERYDLGLSGPEQPAGKNVA